MSCGVGRRCRWDLALLWLWRRLAAVALIHLLAWEPPYATGLALKRQKTHPQKKRKRKVLASHYLLKKKTIGELVEQAKMWLMQLVLRLK